jgi:hypothetical protein
LERFRVLRARLEPERALASCRSAAQSRLDETKARVDNPPGIAISISTERSRKAAAGDPSSLVVLVPTALSLALVAWFGRETRWRDLRDLDPDNGQLGRAEA